VSYQHTGVHVNVLNDWFLWYEKICMLHDLIRAQDEYIRDHHLFLEWTSVSKWRLTEQITVGFWTRWGLRVRQTSKIKHLHVWMPFFFFFFIKIHTGQQFLPSL